MTTAVVSNPENLMSKPKTFKTSASEFTASETLCDAARNLRAATLAYAEIVRSRGDR